MSTPVTMSGRLDLLPTHPSVSNQNKAIRRAVSESRPSRRQVKHAPGISSILAAAWTNEASTEGNMPRRARKCGFPSHPHGPPMESGLPARTLRPTPDSRRVKPRLLDHDTIKTMKAQLGERGDVNAHWLALNGFYGGMDAHYAAYDAAVAAEALDLAVPDVLRKASLAAASRKEEPLTADQDVPSSPHAPFEWDNVDPFGSSPLAGPSRPLSVEERHSTYRKMSQPELEIELARKPRPATLQNHARVGWPARALARALVVTAIRGWALFWTGPSSVGR
ncbi:hypothetical protein RhiJN_18806 [Ceratobasidium sp. AG-Ba]|nr:hypothetical protein RhiJN_18806 [Ceratobasidium sp. AG-Ba]